MAQKIGYALAPSEPGKDAVVPFQDWGWEVNIGNDTFYLRFYQRGSTWKYEVCHTTGTEAALQVDIQAVTTINGLPYRVVLMVCVDDSAPQEITLGSEDRVSLKALRGKEPSVAYLLEESGYYLTKYVYLLGPVSAGKSCFMCSAQTPTLTKKLQVLMKGGGPTLHTLEIQERLTPTNIGAIDPFAFEIPGKRDGISGVVYFVDLSGEIGIERRRRRRNLGGMRTVEPDANVDEASLRNHVINIIARTADGLLVIYDKRILFRSADVGGEMMHGDPENVIKELRRMHRLPRLFSYVVTGADEIQRLLKEGVSPLEGVILTAQSPVFCSMVEQCGDCDENLYQHMAIARDALGSVLNAPAGCGCFLVSSLEVIHGGEQEPLFDFSKGRNVELPLYWMFQCMVRLGDCE